MQARLRHSKEATTYSVNNPVFHVNARYGDKSVRYEPVVTAYAIRVSSNELVLPRFTAISEIDARARKTWDSRLDPGPASVEHKDENARKNGVDKHGDPECDGDPGLG